MLLAAAFVSYSGCFSKRFRKQLLEGTYLPYLKGEIAAAKGGVPMSAGADPINILSTEADRAVWAGEHRATRARSFPSFRPSPPAAIPPQP